ncbi:MAG TPA: response regulator transcription factor [Candidatus Limnocylindria bacterium]|nr:response regulator transcription factor [Candidatus Limnocylindria bacterium]
MSGASILIVDDEPAILRTLRTNIRAHGYVVDVATTGTEALERHERGRPDLVVLDLNLPDIDGIEVIRRIRQRGATPIIVLSVRDAERDKVAALDAGADDYVTKPFGADELLARVRAGLRRLAGPERDADGVLVAGDLRVDLQRRAVQVRGQHVRLTPTEYDLLKVFLRYPDRVLTDRMLLQEVWGPSYSSESHYLHVYVARLRKKLQLEAETPAIVTEPGVGYRFVVDG